MHIHITGIAGSLLAPLAVELKNQGHIVTGSDKAFYPPASTLLEENDIKIIPGFKPDKFEKIGIPDLAVLMSFYTPNNPEVIFLKNKGVEIIGLGQLLERYFIKENSIVVAGSAGKTTITSLLSWILETADMDPSIMVGGVMKNFGSGVKIGKSNWTVTEGDEFKNWNIDKDYNFTKKSRLHYQGAKYAILTGASWDHYDIFPTEENYFNNFKKFAEAIPENGFVVGNASGKNVDKIFENIPCKKIYYNLTKKENCFWADNIEYSEGKSSFDVYFNDKLIEQFILPMLGEINIENALASIALATNLEIPTPKIQKALESFQGVKRRQEVRFENDKVIIYDDFAHSPIKVEKLLLSLRKHYPENKIILVYQPGNKDEKALSEYTADNFKNADIVFLPRVSSISKESSLFNKKLFDYFKNNNIKDELVYEDDDEKIVKKIKEACSDTDNQNVVVFAAQKGFRKIIDALITDLK